MKLSILICTLPTRIHTHLPSLLNKLLTQAEGKQVEILYLGDNKKRTTGQKRNDLIAIASGEYLTFVDDDDDITPDYVNSLLEGIAHDTDVVCFEAMYTHNKQWSKNVRYDFNFEKDYGDEHHFYRIPNHLMCWKSSLAKKIKFEDKTFGEDAAWAKEMKKVAKSQYIIPNVLYYYHFNERTTESRGH